MVKRSILMVPADDPSQVGQAAHWGADALTLDLERMVHPSKRALAREQVRDLIGVASQGGSDVLVRINKAEAQADLSASIWPGTVGVMVPQLEGGQEVEALDTELLSLERQRGLEAGQVKINVFVDTGKGLYNALEIASASPRVESIVLAFGDLAFDLRGVEEDTPIYTGPMPKFPSPQYAWGWICFTAAAARVQPLGLLGTTVAPGYADAQAFLEAATVARKLGFKGAVTIHREGVDTCNQGFSLPKATVEKAQALIDRVRAGESVRAASARRAEAILARAQAIRTREER